MSLRGDAIRQAGANKAVRPPTGLGMRRPLLFSHFVWGGPNREWNAEIGEGFQTFFCLRAARPTEEPKAFEAYTPYYTT